MERKSELSHPSNFDIKIKLGPLILISLAYPHEANQEKRENDKGTAFLILQPTRVDFERVDLLKKRREQGERKTYWV